MVDPVKKIIESQNLQAFARILGVVAGLVSVVGVPIGGWMFSTLSGLERSKVEIEKSIALIAVENLRQNQDIADLQRVRDSAQIIAGQVNTKLGQIDTKLQSQQNSLERIERWVDSLRGTSSPVRN